jgi:hypothetical protein
MYSVDINARLKFITVTFSGAVDIAERSCAWEEMTSAIDSFGNCRILLDFMAATVAADDFQTSRTFARRVTYFAGVEGRRVAYLCPPGAHVNKVVEVLVDARGLTIERFNDRVEALRWLLSDLPDQKPLQLALPRHA